MYRYVIKRVLFLIPTILGVTFIIFFVMGLTPGNPGRMILGPTAKQEAIDELNHELGYDLPIAQRYVNYLKDIVTEGDFGTSYFSGRPVFDEIWPRFLVTIRMSLLILVISVCVGVPVGIYSAVKQYSLWDTVPTMMAFFLAAVPSFVIGMVLLYFFALKINIFPSYGLDGLKSYILPVSAVAISEAAAYLRFTKSSMLEAIRQDYVRTARGKGVPERTVIWKHAMRNALLPVITCVGHAFRSSFGWNGDDRTTVFHPGNRQPYRGQYQQKGRAGHYCSQHFDRLRIYHADAFGRYRLCLCGPQDTCQIQQIGAVNMSAMTGRVKDADRGEFKKTGQFHEIFRRLRKDRGAMVGLVILIVLIFVIIFADMIVPYQAAISQDVMNNFAAPSAEHFMGTDMYGRDVFARFVHGARTSLAISLFASVTSCVFGSLLGAAAGYFGGKVDMAIMRCLDIFMSVPDILFTMVVVAALGSSIPILIVAMTLAYFTNYVRLVRSEVLNLCEQEYVEAAKAGGASSARIILSHIIPNALGIILVNLTLNVASLVIYQSSLSYIGLSLPQPTPEWGSMLSEAREFMLKAPHLVFFPAAAIVLTAFSVNLLGDGLRDAMDPRLKN